MRFLKHTPKANFLLWDCAVAGELVTAAWGGRKTSFYIFGTNLWILKHALQVSWVKIAIS